MTEEKPRAMGRRHFIKTLLGVGSVAAPGQPAMARETPAGRFFWCDLQAGFVGFPTGTSLPQVSPGSVMKLITAAALVDAHLIRTEDTFLCNGSLVEGGQKVSCKHAHGRIDIVKALAFSCNVAFSQMIRSLNPALLVEYARRFHLNDPVCGVAPAAFPAADQDNMLNLALGLSGAMKVSPLHLLQLSGLVALRGQLPVLFRTDQEKPKLPPVTTSLSSTAWHVLQDGMRLCVREGTAGALDPADKLHVAAKTGTVPRGEKFESWLTGFFPYEKPRHAFVLFSPSGTSFDAAVPAAAKFLATTHWPE